MKRNLLISSLFCTALLGCGDDKGQDTNTTKTSQTSVSETDGASSTGGTDGTTVDPTNPTNNPTTTTDPTATTADPSATDTGTGTTASFIQMPDGGGGGTIECDVFKQDCDPGEKCTAWAEGGGGAWNATKCVMVTGDKVPGDVCTTEGGGVSGIDDCEAGAMCWDVSAENMGICVALCKGTPDAPTCDDGFSCAIVNDGVLNICLPGCDPLLQDCDGDDLCLPIGDGFICVLDASGEMGKTNDPCEFANACDKGLVCLNTASASSACMQGSQGCCQPFCDFGMMDPCPNPDQKCVQWFDPMMPIPPGFEDVGVCAIPM
jgi:hypothetical protein